MKILLVSDYFYPFTPGGSEWSVYELARALKKNNVEVVIATLNYGAKTKDVYRKVKVIRIPFLKKLQSSRSVVNPIWQNNPFFFISSAYHLFRIVKSENPNIIHIHGKLAPLFAELAKHNVIKIDTRNLDLEEVFLRYYQGRGVSK